MVPRTLSAPTRNTPRLAIRGLDVHHANVAVFRVGLWFVAMLAAPACEGSSTESAPSEDSADWTPAQDSANACESQDDDSECTICLKTQCCEQRRACAEDEACRCTFDCTGSAQEKLLCIRDECGTSPTTEEPLATLTTCLLEDCAVCQG